MHIDIERVVATVLFLFVLTALVSIRSPIVSGKAIVLLRALFPSWRFFEEVTEVPVLEYRTSSDGTSYSNWRPGIIRPVRKWYNLFVNPDGNLYMAFNSLLQFFEDEIQRGLENPHNSTSNALIRELVLDQIRKDCSSSQLGFFQFRISKLYQGSALDQSEELFVSERFSF